MTAQAPTNSGYWTDSGNYATSFAGGTGIESDPYLISTPQQLARLAYLINGSSSSSYRSLYYEQTADLDMSAYWWDAIGTSSHYFSGYYDGGGHTISGLYTEAGTTSTYSYQGLFGYIEGTTSNFAEIHDVGIINSEIQGYRYIGGIAGYVYNFVEIFNCYNYSSVNATGSGVGGIVGNSVDFTSNSSNITNCFNAGNIVGMGHVGGIVGYTTSSIYDCYNIGNVSCSSTNSYIGGIVGYINPGTNSENILEINSCYNTGNVIQNDNAQSNYTGGIVGDAIVTDISICYNEGDVEGGYYVGGILGRGGANVYDCYNAGDITSDYFQSSVGGIIGYIAAAENIRNCYNRGNIVSSISDAGGITGRMYSATTNIISNVINLGVVTGDNADEIAPSSSNIAIRYDYDSSYATNAKDVNWYINGNWDSNYPWDFEETWGIVDGMNDGYPILVAGTTFTITYHPNGASGDEVVESKVGSESYTIRSNMFSRSGYNFTGWNTEANGGGTSYSAGSSYSDLANLDLYAQWSRITYTIKYDKNASDATGSMANTTKYYGTNVTLRSNAFSRTGYDFAGWATSSGGAVVYANGATYSANANVTLYAKWTAHKYTVKFNGNGSTSGSMSNQTFTYGTAQKLTSNAFTKTGFTFAGWNRNANGTGTSYTNGQSVSNLTSSNGATINLYAQWTARNEAKYDSAGGYWYIENGKIPQTKVTNSTLISNLNKATTNGANYYIAGQTLTAKVYSGKEYCKWNNNWYEVEPIKWRLDASSSQKDGYGTTTDTNAVLAEIVYVDQYSSSSIDAGEGYSNQSVTDFMRNGISTTYLVNYATSTQTFGTGTTLYGSNASTTARMFVSSQSEITNVIGNMNMTFSDLVEDMIKYYGGTNVYFTRDLGSNYNNIVCFNEVGREVQRFATDYRGVQFTVRFTEYGCVN